MPSKGRSILVRRALEAAVVPAPFPQTQRIPDGNLQESPGMPEGLHNGGAGEHQIDDGAVVTLHRFVGAVLANKGEV